MSSILNDQICVQTFLPEKKYFSSIPHLVTDLEMDNDSKILYLVLVRWAWGHPTVALTNKFLCKKAGQQLTRLQNSKKELTKKRPELGGKSLVTIQYRKNKETKQDLPPLFILSDIWPENMKHILNQFTSSHPPDGVTFQKEESHLETDICEQDHPLSFNGTPPIVKQHPPYRLTAPLIKRNIKKEKNKAKKSDGLDTPPPKTGAKPPVSSPAAHRLCVFLFEKLKEKNPTHRQPNMNKWAREMDKILRIDKRSEEELKEVITWAFNQTDGFWPIAIQSPQTLRKVYDKARMKINHNPTQKAQDVKEKNIAYSKALLPRLEREIPSPKLLFSVIGDAVEIVHGRHAYYVDLKTHGFKDRLKGELIKRGVSSETVLRLIA